MYTWILTVFFLLSYLLAYLLTSLYDPFLWLYEFTWVISL